METLKLLIKAMREAVALNKKLEMSSYFDGEEPRSTDTLHTCGTAACVLGYGALAVDDLSSKNEIAERLWDSLGYEIGEPLADSIADDWVEVRMREAKIHFGEDSNWLKEQKHLTSNNPTAQDALDYMLEVKKRLQNS